MAFDFPVSPTFGQQYTLNGVTYAWNGYAWDSVGEGSGGNALVPTVDTPPPTPQNGQLWWESDSGATFIWFDDGNTAQWVQINGGGGSSGTALVPTDDAAPVSPLDGQLWWRSDKGQLYIFYDDGNSQQWVQANPTGAPGAVKTALAKNLVVNPSMQISQENGFGSAITVTNTYAADQWQLQSSVPFDGAASQLAYGNQMYIRNTSAKPALAATDLLYVTQPIEGFMAKDLAWGTTGGKPAVLRLEVFCNVAGTYAASIRSSSSPPDRSFVGLFTVAANTWTTVEIPIPPQTGGTWGSDSALGMRLDISLAMGSTYTAPAAGWSNGNYLGAPGMSNGMAAAFTALYIKNVGLHVDLDSTGKAPPYQIPDYSDELRRCQRYYRKIAPAGITWPYPGSGVINAPTSARVILPYTTPLRTFPTIALAAANTFVFVGTAGYVPTSISAGTAGPDAAVIEGIITGGTAGHGCYLREGTGASFIALNARMT